VKADENLSFGFDCAIAGKDELPAIAAVVIPASTARRLMDPISVSSVNGCCFGRRPSLAGRDKANLTSCDRLPVNIHILFYMMIYIFSGIT
jgi:hypothetical protein